MQRASEPKPVRSWARSPPRERSRCSSSAASASGSSPARGRSRVLIAMPVTLALGGYFLVESFNSDFIILGPDVLLVGLFLLLVAAMGGVIAWLGGRLGRARPPPG